MKPTAEIVETQYGKGIVVHDENAESGPLYAIPPGWKLVPTEPTPEMMHALYGPEFMRYEDAYRSMLAAAPEPPSNAGLSGHGPKEPK